MRPRELLAATVALLAIFAAACGHGRTPARPLVAPQATSTSTSGSEAPPTGTSGAGLANASGVRPPQSSGSPVTVPAGHSGAQVVLHPAGAWSVQRLTPLCGTMDTRSLRAWVTAGTAYAQGGGALAVHLYNNTDLCGAAGSNLHLSGALSLVIEPGKAGGGTPLSTVTLPAPPQHLAPGEEVDLGVELAPGLAPGPYTSYLTGSFQVNGTRLDLPGPSPFGATAALTVAPGAPPTTAVETPPPSVSLPAAPFSVSSGPRDDQLAAALANDTCIVAQGGRITRTIPLCGAITWVPQSGWIVYAKTTSPTIQGTTVAAYEAAEAGGCSSVPLPCASGLPAYIQGLPGPAASGPSPTAGSGPYPAYIHGLPGPAVAYDCLGRLDILPLGSATAQPQPVAWLNLPLHVTTTTLFAIDPTRSWVAVTHPDGSVGVYLLANGRQLSGTYMAGRPEAMAWAGNGVLAITSSEGITLWNGSGARTVAKPANDNVLAWLPNNSAVVAATSYHGAVAPAGYQVDVTGNVRQILAPRPDATYFAWTADGRFVWYGPYQPAGEPASYELRATGGS